MRYGVIYPGSDPEVAVDLAADAERAGWDGFFLSEGVWATDAWSTLAAAAMRTSRIRLGTMLTPVPRRRAWELADQTRTVDRLSRGRVILGAGLGVPQSVEQRFWIFEDDPGRAVRAELLDETLELVERLWHDDPVEYRGRHLRAEPTGILIPPPAVQSPRIPIWVVGAWPRPRSMRRVARFDGWIPNFLPPGAELRSPEDQAAFTPEHLREALAWLSEERRRISRSESPFDVVQEGTTSGGNSRADRAMVEPWARAGATWWLEADWSRGPDDVDSASAVRVAAGPPRI